MNGFRLAFAAFAALALWGPASAWSQPPVQYQFDPLYLSYFEAGGRAGDGFDGALGSLFLTTVQDEFKLFFADVRGNWSDPNSWTGNLGFAYRCMNPATQDWVVGKYVYYDRMRSVNGHNYDQATLGLEFMSVQWDVRVNGYLPELEGGRLGPSYGGYWDGKIVLQTPEELAFPGSDVEVGMLVADSPGGSVELRAFAAGYYFDRDVIGFREIAGGRARVELRMFDLKWLGEGSRVMIGGQCQWDDARGDDASGLLSVRIPLGPKTGRRLGRLQRRMLNPIVRNFSIVTQSSIRTEYALDAETGSPFGPVELLDANRGDPAGAFASARSGGLIVADGSAGRIDVGTPLVMRPGQTLRGAGFAIVGEDTGRSVIFGSEPTISGVDPTQDVVVLANNTTVRDITFNGGRNHLFGDVVSDIEVYGNVFDGAQQSGLSIVELTSGAIYDNAFENNAISGVSIGTMTDGSVDGNSVVSGGVGFMVDTMDGGVFSLNSVSGAPTDGFVITTMNGGRIADNTVENAINDGIAIGTMNAGTIATNWVSGAGRYGYHVQSFITGDVAGNVAIAGFGEGFRFDDIDSDIVAGNISGNLAMQNAVGFHFLNVYGGDIEFNVAEENTGDGFIVDTFDSHTWVTDNASNRNGGNGFTFSNLPGGGFIYDNTADENDGLGFEFGDIHISGVLDNTATNNLAGGFSFNALNNGHISGNVADNNLSHGFSFVDLQFGSVDANSAIGNTGHGFFVNELTLADLDGNTANLNGLDGFFVGGFDGSILGEIANNVADGNSDDGFDIGSGLGWVDGDLTDNTSTNNVNFGFRISNRTGGSASGNVATGNADNTLPAP